MTDFTVFKGGNLSALSGAVNAVRFSAIDTPLTIDERRTIEIERDRLSRILDRCKAEN